ncbi:MAG: Amidohydrolase 3 [Caulobacteraceae bacterium]|nr:Amidohydrolase 3 [Caulobacteraceae bacterium]
MHDIVIRGGDLVDGTGAEPRVGDLAIDGGLISAVGEVAGAGRREIDASGLVVSPGPGDGRGAGAHVRPAR